MSSAETEIDAEQISIGVGVIRELGDLPAEAIISEEGLAKIFHRHKVSIKRAVERGELPPTVRLFGEPVWTVKVLREHMGKRLDAAQKESKQLLKDISKFSV
jgi:hypothetical protein